MEELEESIEKRMAEYAPIACGALEDARGLHRDAAKFIEKSGCPQEFHTRALKLLAETEDLEAAVSEYAVGTVDTP